MNASCMNVRELIPLFPDDLDSNEVGEVREHVARCGECAAELGVFAAQAAVFAQVREGRKAETVDLFGGIQAKLAQPAPRGEVVRLQFGVRALFAAAAAGVVVAFGLFAFAQKPVDKSEGSLAHEQPKAPPIKPTMPEVKPSGTGQIEPTLVGNPEKRDARRSRSPRRRIFEQEGASPFFGGSDKKFVDGRELTPLDEEAEIPQAHPRKQRFAPGQPAQPNKSGDEESLRF